MIVKSLLGGFKHSETRSSILRAFFDPSSALWQTLISKGIIPRPHQDSEEIIDTVTSVVRNKQESDYERTFQELMYIDPTTNQIYIPFGLAEAIPEVFSEEAWFDYHLDNMQTTLFLSCIEEVLHSAQEINYDEITFKPVSLTLQSILENTDRLPFGISHMNSISDEGIELSKEGKRELLEYDVFYAILETKLNDSLDGFDVETLSRSLDLKRSYWLKGKTNACGEIPIVIELKERNRDILWAIAEGKKMPKPIVDI